MFSKVLVANRGEIAVRVMRACRELGIRNVGVYSDADKKSFFRWYADEAYYIGESPAAESYLNMKKIIDIAKLSDSDAVHPGYGFLAENAEFAEMCRKENIVFIGPRAETIREMGNKILARKIMSEAGVPVVPGSEREIRDFYDALRIAKDIGFPVMLKAAGGGGGIGMKIVKNEEELEDAIESCKSIAKSAFGNESIFIEKYIEKPRHIEVQILGDGKNIVHLYERECSIQRRYQKLIEEAPSPALNPEMRRKITEYALKAAEVLEYENAGTIEFVYKDGSFYFIEANTRLQVEHPVTEMITGMDIVKEQIRIAAGEKMSFEQGDVNIRGHAIECRVNAEDPLKNFAPATGRIKRYRSPGGPGVRVDSGVHMGYYISPYYDSMISKLIVWGRDRNEAVDRMIRALYDYVIAGVKTNLPLHMAIISSEAFRKGMLHTKFIEENNILEEIKKMIEFEALHIKKLEEIFEEDKKIPAISAAVNAYVELWKKENKKKEK